VLDPNRPIPDYWKLWFYEDGDYFHPLYFL
jgi:hypothetical protein